MRVTCGHDDGFALAEFVTYAVDSNSAHAVKASHERVAARFVRGNFLVLVEREQRYADVGVLRKRFADDLTVLIGDLVFERDYFRFVYVFNKVFYNYTAGSVT